MIYKTIKTNYSKNILTISLNRPKHFNAINLKMAKELYKLSVWCEETSDLRCIIFTGEGDKAFCAGGDVHSFYKQKQNISLHLKEVTHFFHGAISRFSRTNLPIIASINGVAAGGGLSFVGFADLVICSLDATFMSAYSKIGFTPDGSTSFFLPRIIGVRRYKEFVITDRILSANDAFDWNLVNFIIPEKNKLKSETKKLAQNVANGPTLAFGKLKAMLINTFNESLEGQMELETRFLSDSSITLDGKLGVEAFVNKTKPKFVGK